MKIKHLGDCPSSEVSLEGAAHASVQKPVSSADGAPNFSMRVFTLAPGGHTPFHTHPWEHENYIIEGAGELVDETGNGRPVRKGDFCLVLAGEKHQYRNTSDDAPMAFICAVPVENE